MRDTWCYVVSCLLMSMLVTDASTSAEFLAKYKQNDTTAHNDITKWEEQLAEDDYSNSEMERVYEIQTELLDNVKTLAEQVTAMRIMMGNLKLQNHLIYRQLKRIRKNCFRKPEFRSLAQTRKSCPQDFVHHAGTNSCYKFSSSRITWRMARERCKAIGADLVSIQSSKEQQFVIDYAKKNSDLRHCDFWIGASDQEQEGKWQWVANGEHLTYEHWNHNEPNNGMGDEHCAHMLWVFNWAWNDARCNYDNSCFICQKGL